MHAAGVLDRGQEQLGPRLRREGQGQKFRQIALQEVVTSAKLVDEAAVRDSLELAAPRDRVPNSRHVELLRHVPGGTLDP